ncbi:hypothetical protein VE04_07209 [Pseudogymnoascus sp. 24MN13]|nr:hypothetical protein VE04_07209 [Pseudogymnoascus sp. 24MN13]
MSMNVPRGKRRSPAALPTTVAMNTPGAEILHITKRIPGYFAQSSSLIYRQDLQLRIALRQGFTTFFVNFLAHTPEAPLRRPLPERLPAMCLVRVSKEDDPVEPPRIYVRRRESVSHSRRTSQVVIRPTTTSRQSITRITSSSSVPHSRAPRPVEYVDRDPGPDPDPGNFPMIVQAPTPRRSSTNSSRTSHTHVVMYEGSPRNSRTSVTSRQSVRQGSLRSQRSQRSRQDGRRHSRNNSGEIFIVNPPVRERSRSPAVETRGRADSYAVRHVSVGRESRDPSREPSRERRSKVHLTTPLSPMEVDKVQRGLEASRDTMMVEDVRERVLVEEDGRRKEFYKTKSLSP